jgi:hypothetical protein
MKFQHPFASQHVLPIFLIQFDQASGSGGGIERINAQREQEYYGAESKRCHDLV